MCDVWTVVTCRVQTVVAEPLCSNNSHVSVCDVRTVVTCRVQTVVAEPLCSNNSHVSVCDVWTVVTCRVQTVVAEPLCSNKKNWLHVAFVVVVVAFACVFFVSLFLFLSFFRLIGW